jgi:hypothetical protein
MPSPVDTLVAIDHHFSQPPDRASPSLDNADSPCCHGRWLRFLVRGTGHTNAIMTAVDQAGNRVARYRLLTEDSAEVTVHPDRDLTDELVLALAISVPWLRSYFRAPSVAVACAVILGGLTVIVRP